MCSTHHLAIFATIFAWVATIHGSDAWPYEVVWNDVSYGPDGPWQAVILNVGESQVDLYPSGIWETIVNSEAMCTGSGTCLAAAAGLYDQAKSQEVISNFTDTSEAIGRWGSGAAMNLSGPCINIFDTLTLNTFPPSTDIHNSSIFVASKLSATLPNGSSYPLAVGSLSLGAWLDVQTWGSYRGTTASSYLKDTNLTASRSFGLHYGSALLGPQGSLVFGGYDQARALGSVGSYDLEVNGSMAVNLVDIGLGVKSGLSPFDASTPSGLLKLNASQDSLPSLVNPLVPYLFLPPDTCAAIAEYLPITLDPDIGLYMWNTTDPAYYTILSQPTFMNFSFESTGENLDIRVPLQLFNLTLEAPIVSTPRRYFPCRPYQPTSSLQPFLLGKVFLQAAFIAVNWENQKFFLAQAPGPDVGPKQVQDIASSATTIATNSLTDFDTSWASYGTPNYTLGSADSTVQHKHHASKSAKAGIHAAIAVVVLVIAAIAAFFSIRWWRRSAASRRLQGKSQNEPMLSEAPDEKPLQIGVEEPKEMGSPEAHEIPGDQLYEVGERDAIHEMDGQNDRKLHRGV